MGRCTDGQLLRYIIAGLVSMGVNFGVFALLRGTLAANVISVSCAVITAFVLNRYYVFHSEGSFAKELAAFVSSRIFTIVLEIAGTQALMFLGAGIAKITMQVVITVLNYIISRFGIWKA